MNIHNSMYCTQAAALSELPGYLGRRHMRQSHYVTAELPCEAISTIDQNFTRAIPGLEPPGYTRQAIFSQ